MSAAAHARTLLRWSAAIVFAAGAHAGVAAVALNWQPTADVPAGAPPAVMIDLATLEAPKLPNLDIAPGQESVESEPVPEPPQVEKAVEAPQDIPPLPENTNAIAVLHPPMPQPKPDERETPKPDRAEKKKHEHRKVASRTSAPSTYEAQRAALASAPAAGAATASASVVASWRSQLMAHLNSYKRYPSGANGTGIATVAFTINRSGQVLGSRLTHSSGDSTLDQEAVGLARRASPMPAPPSGLGGATIALTVPIRFNR
jgi:protein TonB